MMITNMAGMHAPLSRAVSLLAHYLLQLANFEFVGH